MVLEDNGDMNQKNVSTFIRLNNQLLVNNSFKNKFILGVGVTW